MLGRILEMDDKRELLFRGAKAGENFNDQYDDTEDVNNLRTTIGALKQVSADMGNELERHNAMLDNMQEGMGAGQAILSKLLKGMDQVYQATGLSPTSLTFIFSFGVVIFLWAYWKFFA